MSDAVTLRDGDLEARVLPHTGAGLVTLAPGRTTGFTTFFRAG